MRRCTVFIAAIALTLGTALSAAAEERALAGFLGRIAAERPLVKWDAKSAVEGNFDGNHGVTFAALGYKDKQVMVAIGRKATDGSVIAQYLEFGIGAGTQNAICKLPAHLKVYPLNCTAYEDGGGEKLPGCKETAGASGLKLDDDECDPIEMYWNHSTNQMMWWRN